MGLGNSGTKKVQRGFLLRDFWAPQIYKKALCIATRYFLSLTKVMMVMRRRMIVVKLIEHVLCARLCADCFLCVVSPHIPHVVQHTGGKEAWGQSMGMGVRVGL